MYYVVRTDTYYKQVKKWSRQITQKADKLLKKLKNQPDIGKPLTHSFFKEVKLEDHRIYYLIYDEFKLIIVVGASRKKDQQDAIDKIKERFEEYKELAKKITRQT